MRSAVYNRRVIRQTANVVKLPFPQRNSHGQAPPFGTKQSQDFRLRDRSYDIDVFGVLTGPHGPQNDGASALACVVPVDAAFYSASLRLKEQLDIFLESKTYQRLNEIGLVQIGKAQLMLLWQQAAMPQVAEFRQYVESPEGQDAIALLKDMFSEETFVYGSSDVADALAMFTAVNSISRQARIEAIAGGEDAEEVVQQRTMDVLAEHIEKFKIPTLVMAGESRMASGPKGSSMRCIHSLAICLTSIDPSSRPICSATRSAAASSSRCVGWLDDSLGRN